MSKKSPLAPARFPVLPPVAGVQVAAAAAGVKYKGRDDVFLASLASGTNIAGVTTTSKTCSSSVEWTRSVVAKGKARGVIVNAGNANAFTGKAGAEGTRHMASAAAKVLDCKPKQVVVASTGVIGEKLPGDRISDAMPGLAEKLSDGTWRDAAGAIMTTDTFPKGAGTVTEIGGVEVSIAGIAKGSGMIAPDMATMLAFVFTDAAIPAPMLQKLLRRSADRSFNAITVDGDTSTSDTLVLAATGKARNKKPKSIADKNLKAFRSALDAVLIDLAQQVVKDGEGAQKFITINVTGADSADSARRIGLAIGNSPLVKTAIAGEDANWGRVVMAVGKSGQPADRDRLSIAMGGTVIAEKGEGVVGYDEAPVAEHLKGRDIVIDVDLGIGKGKACVWTCDLTHGYIDINADYRS
jgi:glutamate N-acetyltransferase/amino-acid N-acetyltransferase